MEPMGREVGDNCWPAQPAICPGQRQTESTKNTGPLLCGPAKSKVLGLGNP